MMDYRLKEKLDLELLEKENEIALPGNLQAKREMADMFERMVNPEYQEQRILENNRKRFIKNKISKVGL